MRGCPALTPLQLQAALGSLIGRRSLRDRALIVLGVRTGLRISELLSLRLGQVWDGNEVVSRFYLHRSATKGKQAGASIVIHPEAALALTHWLRSQAGGRHASSFVFSSQKNSRLPLSRQSAWRILHGAFVRAGVRGMAGTHCMRKTFAKNVYKSLKGDLFRLSKAMRHASPLITVAYLSFNQDEIDQAILTA